MFCKSLIGGISYQKRFKSRTFCSQEFFEGHSAGIKHSYFDMIHPGIFFQFWFPLSSEILLMFMAMNVLVLSYMIASGKQLLIQHDAMNTKVRCLLGIIKQFLQHLFHSNKIKDN